jgi:hypothetical protein
MVTSGQLCPCTACKTELPCAPFPAALCVSTVTHLNQARKDSTMNTHIDLLERNRVHELAVARALQMRREAIAGFADGLARTVLRFARRLARGAHTRPRRIHTLEA